MILGDPRERAIQPPAGSRPAVENYGSRQTHFIFQNPTHSLTCRSDWLTQLSDPPELLLFLVFQFCFSSGPQHCGQLTSTDFAFCFSRREEALRTLSPVWMGDNSTSVSSLQRQGDVPTSAPGSQVICSFVPFWTSSALLSVA